MRRAAVSPDGIFHIWWAKCGVVDEAKSRPIVIDSRRDRAKSESRKFPFEIKSDKF
jgi:hypothetical protein